MTLNIASYIKCHHRRIIRFFIIGAVTYLLNNAFLWFFLSKVLFGYRAAVTCSYVLTVICHFELNRSFTYAVQGQKLRDGGKYLLMLGLNYCITLFAVTFTVEFFGLAPYFGLFFATFLTAFSSFLLMNHFVFNRGRLGVK